ncbi:MAG TPA: DNA translocase FtsK 4TM domain-containing protein [bacterium]|nr:DNA translocase FtsK 4TM domain-containing protein [bacterium]
MKIISKTKEERNEIAGIALLTLSLLILLSLVSYQMGRCIVGALGRYLALSLIAAFGWGAYFLPCSIGYWGWKTFQKGKKIKGIWVKLSGLGFLLLAFCSFLNLLGRQTRLGGTAGDFVSDSLLVPAFGETGTYLIVLTVFLISIQLVTETSIIQFLQTLRKTVQVVRARPPGIKHLISTPEVKPDSYRKVSPQVKAESVSPVSPLGALTFELPSIELLDDPPRTDLVQREEELKNNAEVLEKTLKNFGISAKVSQIHPGPVITRYELELAPGIKVSSVKSLSNDLALTLRTQSIRILAPIPGKAAVGIEIPNQSMALVCLKELLQSPEFKKSASFLSLALGKTVAGKTYIADLNQMPHLLIAGATGSGKTVSINTIILSILYKARPEEVKFLLIDPKMVELPIYNGIPHLKSPVVTNVKHAVAALKWIVGEMENRYRRFAATGTRDIFEYNQKFKEEGKKIPFIVIIIDELADLMATAPNQIEQVIIRLAQMSRAVGIHLVLATQRPSVNVITGIIKANLPARLAFEVISKVDSRTILDMNGAENLLGRGDMLFLAPGEAKPIRLQGAFISGEEINRVVTFIKQQGEATYSQDLFHLTKISEEKEEEEEDQEIRKLFKQALRLTLERRQASTSLFKGALHISDGKATNLISLMETKGFVGPQQGSKPRQIFLDKIEQFWQKIEKDEDN